MRSCNCCIGLNMVLFYDCFMYPSFQCLKNISVQIYVVYIYFLSFHKVEWYKWLIFLQMPRLLEHRTNGTSWFEYLGQSDESTDSWEEWDTHVIFHSPPNSPTSEEDAHPLSPVPAYQQDLNIESRRYLTIDEVSNTTVEGQSLEYDSSTLLAPLLRHSSAGNPSPQLDGEHVSSPNSLTSSDTDSNSSFRQNPLSSLDEDISQDFSYADALLDLQEPPLTDDDSSDESLPSLDIPPSSIESPLPSLQHSEIVCKNNQLFYTFTWHTMGNSLTLTKPVSVVKLNQNL